MGSVLLLTVPAEGRLGRMALAAGTILVTLSILAWSRHLWLSVGAIAFQSMAISTSLGLASIIVQEMVPDPLRGRVMSLYSLMFTGVMPFSSLLITTMADGIGMRHELQISAVSYAAMAVWLLWRFQGAEAAK